MEWWTRHRPRFEVFVSDLVLLEASRGDRVAASKRLAELAGISVLQTNEEARELARKFVNRWLFPKKAVEDAFHVAIATVQGMDFLLSWNCWHIANAEFAEQLRSICEQLGYKMPILCTPEQFMDTKRVKDEIVEEIRRVREEHAARFDYDVDAIYADLKRLEQQSSEPRISLGPRRIRPAEVEAEADSVGSGRRTQAR